ncbi:MAG: leucyl/phenylalanyl-tRNA--protein transferase [Gammaproteobacteria bacterium]|nr:leucyl/phenylalanyl-tRNA--protein transferase [Gammaproteobacteria bacterium]
MTLPWLEETDYSFPPVDTALEDPNGLLAVGGDLSVARLIVAYRQGIFPWYEEGGPLLWWSPNPRSVLIPEQFRISRSLRKKLNSQRFTVTCNQAFEVVVEACSDTRAYTSSTWITPYMQRAYCRLHEMGYAHSIEVWEDKQLVGGLYGVSMGRIFFGESMFHRVTDASKVAFAYLSRLLDLAGFPIIDCQVENPHLNSLGAIDMERQEFLDLVTLYTAKPAPHNLWKPRKLRLAAVSTSTAATSSTSISTTSSTSKPSE